MIYFELKEPGGDGDAGARVIDWILYVSSAAALLYLHYFSVFVLLTVGVWLVVVRWQARARLWPCLLYTSPSPRD